MLEIESLSEIGIRLMTSTRNLSALYAGIKMAIEII
jgi:hypothetical protein